MPKQRSVQFPALVVENIKIKIGLGGLPRNLHSILGEKLEAGVTHVT